MLQNAKINVVAFDRKGDIVSTQISQENILDVEFSVNGKTYSVMFTDEGNLKVMAKNFYLKILPQAANSVILSTYSRVKNDR